jgi:aryl-alcohol dehydrogenase-like predicted oxidoreductase
MSQVALAWLLRQPAVSSVILGVRSVEQLDDGVAASELALPDEAIARLGEASAVPLHYPYEFLKQVDGTW